MMAPAHNMSKRSRRMNWQPKARIMAPLAPDEPSKPSKPRFEGFVGSPKTEISIIRGELPEQVVSLDDTTAAAISAMLAQVGVVVTRGQCLKFRDGGGR